jgi:hypothetical protein
LVEKSLSIMYSAVENVRSFKTCFIQ